MGQCRCVSRSYRCRLSAIHHLFNQSSRLPIILLLCFLSSCSHHLRDGCPSTCCFVEARLWFTLAHSSGQIGVPTNRLPPYFGSSDSLHFLPTAAGYARYELNQLVYSLIFMLILISILYSILATPNCFFFLPKS